MYELGENSQNNLNRQKRDYQNEKAKINTQGLIKRIPIALRKSKTL